MSELTEFGFRMGAAEVLRVAEIDGYAVIWVRTEHRCLEIIVTPKGHKIKVIERPDEGRNARLASGESDRIHGRITA